MDPTGFTHVYGLGEQFLIPGEANGDWAGLQRTPGNPYGNAMVAFNGGTTNGGFNGNGQFPVMYALGDENTLNIMGLQADGSTNQDLAVRVFASEQRTQFILYEDDGWSDSYLNGQVRTTRIQQALEGDVARVTIFPGTGDYPGAPNNRNNRVVLSFRSQTVTEVTLNNVPLFPYDTLEAFNAAESGWYQDKPSMVRAKSGFFPASQQKDFSFRLSGSPF